MTSDRSDDDEIDALLAQGRFAAPIHDRVFEGALRDAGLETLVAPRRRRGVRLLFFQVAAIPRFARGRLCSEERPHHLGELALQHRR
jgi:hypothetical protein